MAKGRRQAAGLRIAVAPLKATTKSEPRRRRRKRSPIDGHAEDAPVRPVSAKRRRGTTQMAEEKPDDHAHLWDPEESLDVADSVSALRRGRLGGEARTRPSTPVEEELRAAALQQLRGIFASLCRREGLDKVPTGSFEKWHFQWLHEAGIHARAKGRVSPEEPLLPALPDEAFESLAAMLREDLVGKGFRGTAADSMASSFRKATASAITTLSRTLRTTQNVYSEVVVKRAEGAANCISVKHRATMLRLNFAHYKKLRSMFAQSSTGDEKDFHRALFCLLLRYKALLEGRLGCGFQAALSGEVFSALRGAFDARFECFASPLNCRYRSFCSAFPDTDEAFGSLGSFFAFAPASGSYELNPPFVDALIAAMVVRLEVLLRQAEADSKALTFLIVVGAQGAGRQDKVWKSLEESPYFRAKLFVKSKDHSYCDGAQHISKDIVRQSPCDTGMFVWQTTRASETYSASEEVMKRLAKSFRSSCPAGSFGGKRFRRVTKRR